MSLYIFISFLAFSKAVFRNSPTISAAKRSFPISFSCVSMRSSDLDTLAAISASNRSALLAAASAASTLSLDAKFLKDFAAACAASA